MLFKRHVNEREVNKREILLYLGVFPLVFMIFGIVMSFYEQDFIHNYINILQSPAILITDFFEIGGIGASFINAALIGFFNLYILKKLEMKINGLIIAAFMTVIGFSFFGKNIINILPIYLGGYLYTRQQNKSIKDIIVIIMFATALSPIISQLIFSHSIVEPLNVILGVGLGVLIGFIITPLSAQMLKFHDGYSLYNIGFTAGILGTLITSVLRTFDINIMPVSFIYQRYDGHIKILMIALFIYLIILGLYINKNMFVNYTDIYAFSGRTVTDFTFLIGYGASFFNMGLLGLVFTFLMIILNATLNGPVLAGIFTVVGFGAFGKHLKNCLPPVLGVMIMALILGLELNNTGIVLAILFSTTIAPIAGKFGIGYGILSGVLHLAVVSNIGIVHGGINLYNNGFSGGLVAGILVPIIDAFRKEK